jgi:hypothetical protein
MNVSAIKQACYNLGYEEPISIEVDGTCWVGPDNDRTYLDSVAVSAEVENVLSQQDATKQALLDRLGITTEEVRLLLS